MNQPTTKWQAVFNRFLKGFFSSAIATTLAAITGITSFNNLTELKAFMLGLVVPLVTGGLLALQKAIDWQDTPQNPVPVEQSEPLDNQPNE